MSGILVSEKGGNLKDEGQDAVCLWYHFSVLQWTDEEDQALREPIIKKFEAEAAPTTPVPGTVLTVTTRCKKK
jgi:hypothetical protein